MHWRLHYFEVTNWLPWLILPVLLSLAWLYERRATAGR